MNYPKAIRTGMAKSGIHTQKELAERTAMTEVAISRILKGATKYPRTESLNKMALAFNVPLFKLLSWGM